MLLSIYQTVLVEGGIMNYSLEVNNLTKKYNNNLVFDNVSFKLEKGKIYGLVGANGPGKSTLIKAVLGLTSYKGSIMVNGYNTKKKYYKVLNDISAIVDYVSFYDYLTCEENLRYFALMYETDLSRVKECMKIVSIKPDKKLVKHYSLGNKQRLGIAISLLKDPDILFLDEPTNGLDPKGIRDLRNLLFSLKDKTIIISSHLISEIEKLTTNILFINNKRITTENLKSEMTKIRFIFGNDYRMEEVNMSDNEVNNRIISLVKKKIPVFRVEESSSLEESLINMMGEDE